MPYCSNGPNRSLPTPIVICIDFKWLLIGTSNRARLPPHDSWYNAFIRPQTFQKRIQCKWRLVVIFSFVQWGRRFPCVGLD